MINNIYWFYIVHTIGVIGRLQVTIIIHQNFYILKEHGPSILGEQDILETVILVAGGRDVDYYNQQAACEILWSCLLAGRNLMNHRCPISID